MTAPRPQGKGAVADLARLFQLPVVLVVDAGRMAGSVAPLVSGFAHFDANVTIAGVILNNVGSDRHEAMLRRALAPLGLPVLAAMRRNKTLTMPSRHLGLVQAGERADLDQFLDRAADERWPKTSTKTYSPNTPAPNPHQIQGPPHPAARATHRRGPVIRPMPSAIRTCWRTGVPKGPKSAFSHRSRMTRCPPVISSTCPAVIPNCTRAALPPTQPS